MRIIKPTSQFKKDYKRQLKGQYSIKLTQILPIIIELLITNSKLPLKYKDHQLQGEYSDCRDCHLTPDLVLIYRIVTDESIHLVRIGSHSELFG